MAKQITQETFDDVVKENIEDFDMTIEEAINDATQQFEAQGVDLSMIVKDLNLYGSGQGCSEAATHPAVAAIDTLNEIQDLQTDSDKLKVKSSLEKIKSECDIDLAHRCLAGKKGAYPALIKTLAKCKVDQSLLLCSLQTLIALSNGQPDLLDNDGLELLCDLLSEYKSHQEIAINIIRLVRHNCIKHEKNRQKFVGAGIIELFVSILRDHKSDAACVKEVCFAMRVLTYDDDVRVPFGKAHDHAKMIVTEGDALKALLEICNEHLTNPGVLGELFSTLGKLAVRNEFCKEIMDLGGTKLFLQTLQQNMDDPSLTKQVLGVLKAVAGNDDVKVAITESGGIELITAAMNQHIKQAQVCESGSAALATLILRNPVHGSKLMACEGPAVILRSMQVHRNDANVQRQACMAIRNLVARTRQNCQPVLELGAEGLINEARQRHPGIGDEAKGALRDLDCKVELKVLWKGEGKGIHQ